MCTIHVVQDQKDVSKETTRRNSPEIRRLQGDKSDIKLYRWENRVYAGSQGTCAYSRVDGERWEEM